MKKCFVVGIAGGTAGGKTTFCEELENRLADISLCSIHMDDYYKPEAQRLQSKAPVTQITYMDDNHPESIDLTQVRKALRTAIDSGKYDVILMEGFLVLYDDTIHDMLDLKLFVDCRADERIIRRIKRNMQWGQSLEQVTDVYLDLVRYRHDEYVENSKWRADFIVNGSKLTEVATKSLVILILQSLNL